MRSLLSFVVLAVELIAAQSLPPCAQSCVAKTRTKCKSTDYTCACLDKKYITKLTKCIGRACNDAESHDAAWYLTSLCNSIGVPLQRVAAADGDSTATSQQIQLELRDNFPIEERQQSFTRTINNATALVPTTRFTSRATAATTTTGFTLPTSGSDSNNGGSGGLSTGTKVGLGLGIPIGVLSVVGAIILGIWYGRRKKEEKVAAASQNSQNHPGGPPQMMHPAHPQQPVMMAPMQKQGAKPYMAHQCGPAELSQNAQYVGHELYTPGGNTIEMPANQTPGLYPPSKGPSPGPLGYSNLPQGYAQTQPINPQQQYYPPPQQPATSLPAPPGQSQHLPGQHQASMAAELPERRKTPNMYE